MAYCGPNGIPLSQFLDWPESDQQAALSWQAHESRRCRDCGTHLDDWSEDKGGSRHAYHAEDYTCPGCRDLQRLQEAPHIAQGTQRGVHLRLATGLATDCPHCSDD